VFALRATDGTVTALKKKDVYVSKVSLTPIAATAMPIIRNQSAEIVTLVNASDSAVTRTCSDWQLSGANGCNLIDGETRAVIGSSTQVTVPARGTKVFFFHKPDWIDN
jgi:N-acetylmuramic acid 6-phosphate (MurNAc-6-P) etherase